MHVIAGHTQIRRRPPIDLLRLVTPLEEVTSEPMSPIEALGISSQEPFHSSDEVSPRRLQDEMKMVAQQTIGMHLPSRFLTNLAEQPQKLSSVILLKIDRFPSITPAQHMIE